MPTTEQIQDFIKTLDLFPPPVNLTMFAGQNLIDKLKAHANEQVVYSGMGMTVKSSNLYPYKLDDGRIVHGVIMNDKGEVQQFLIQSANT